MNEPVKLITTKSDQERANEIKQEIVEAAKDYLAVITKAHREGFQVSVAMGPNAFNEVIIQQLIIAKHF